MRKRDGKFSYLKIFVQKRKLFIDLLVSFFTDIDVNENSPFTDCVLSWRMCT